MFALLDRQSFSPADDPVTDAPCSDDCPRPCAPTALSSVIRSIPAARGGAPATLFTPGGELPAAQAADVSVLVVAGDARRDGVVAALASGGASSVVAAVSCADARERVAAGTSCDLAVVDLGLADGGALELLADLRRGGWRTVVLGGPDDRAEAPAALQAGALAFLLTSAPSASMLCPPRPVAPGDDADGASLAAARELSDREVQVLQCVADGRSNIEIGEELGLSALTVKSHLSRIGRKLGTGDRAGMVAVAMRAYLVR